MNKNNIDEFSFILGLFASDGNLDNSRVRFFCSEEEINFFKLIVMPMIEKSFNVKPTFRYYNTRCYLLAINSTKVEKFFRSIFQYKGPKKFNLKMPNVAFDDYSFISGLIAGDGSITIAKNNSKKNNYPILQFVNSSKVLINFFTNFLNKNRINYYEYKRKDDSYQIIVRGREVRKFLSLVPLLNPVQESKLKVFEKYGYLYPWTTYKERLKMLDAPVVQPG